MTSISAVNPIPSTLYTTPVAPISAVASKAVAPADNDGDNDGSGAAARAQPANPPGVGTRLDIRA